MMGVCYTILMQDDFDWGYVNTSKELKIGEFTKEFLELHKFSPTLRGQWYGFMVWDIEKRSPDWGDTNKLIHKFCDCCYWWGDNSPWNIRRLEVAGD
jgi:hypothetical protein